MALTVRSLWFLKPGALAHTSPAPISSYQPWTSARDGTQGLEERLLTARMPRKEVPQRRGKVGAQPWKPLPTFAQNVSRALDWLGPAQEAPAFLLSC